MIFTSGAGEADHLARAGERAARAPARHEEVEAPTGEVAQDLGAGRAAVVGRIRGILELARKEPAVLACQLLGLAHHAGAALRRGREDHLRAEHAHDLAALHREGLRHRRDERVTLRGTHHGERDTGVAGGRLDDRLARLEQPALLGVLDDRDREPVLHRGERIEELALHVHGHVRGRAALNAHDRGAADRSEDAVVDHVATVVR
jgi:hypothetical protein